MAINISFTSDTAEVIRGTDRVAKSLEDMGRELEDVADEFQDAGRQAERTGDQIGDSLKDAGREVERFGDDSEKLEDALKGAGKGADKFEDQVRDAMRKAADHAKTSSKQIGDDTRQGFDRASEGADEFKDEAAGTAREAAASFDGSAESIADMFQETAANAFVGFGPAGAIAGLAIAAGLGIGIAKAQELAEENTAAAERVGDLAAEYIDLKGKLEQLDIGSIIRDWGTEVTEDNAWTLWVDEAQTNFEKYASLAEDAGLRGADAFRGLKGTLEDSQRFLEATSERYEELNRVVEEGTYVGEKGIVVYNDAAEAALGERDALRELRDGAADNSREHESAIGIYEETRDVVGEVTAEYEAQTEAVNNLAEATLDARGTEREMIAAQQDLGKTLGENKDAWGANTEAGRDNMDAVDKAIKSVNDWGQAEVDAGGNVQDVTRKMGEQRDSLIKTMTQHGVSKEAARKYVDEVLRTPKKTETDVTLDTGPADREWGAWHSRKRTVVVDMVADTSQPERALASLNGRTIRVNANYVARPGVPVAD